MPQPVPHMTYATLTSLFTTHLTIAIHTIVAARALYPSTTFLRARAYNLPIMQSRHPGVCAWINDAVAAVEAELLKGTVARIALVIWEAWWEGDAVGGGEEAREQNENMGARPLERYVWDVSRWPEVPKEDLNTPLMRASSASGEEQGKQAGVESRNEQQTDEERRTAFTAILKKAHSDLHEQFRALLVRLTTMSSKLAPLPGGAERCTYTVAVELKEESDPPIGHPQAWIPSERGLGRRIVHAEEETENCDGVGDDSRGVGKVGREQDGGRLIERGVELGGVRTTPVRTVDQGEMIFEMWIEEGKAKFDNRYTKKP